MSFKYLLVDWQTIADDEMIKFLENDIVSQLMHIIETPLHELGKETMIGEHCECDRQQCVACWIQKKSCYQWNDGHKTLFGLIQCISCK